MNKCYVVMRTFESPIAFVIPSPAVVFETRKEAIAFMANKNANRRSKYSYYLRTAERFTKEPV